MFVVNQNRGKIDKFFDRPIFQLFERVDQRQQMIIERGRLASRKGFFFKIVMVGVAYNENDLIKFYVL